MYHVNVIWPNMRWYAALVVRSESSLNMFCYLNYSGCEHVSHIEPRPYSATKAHYTAALNSTVTLAHL